MLPFAAVAAGAYFIYQIYNEDDEVPSTPKKNIRKRKRKPRVIESPPSVPPTPVSEPQEPASAEIAPSDVPTTPSPVSESPVPDSKPSDSVDPQSQTES